MFLFLTSPVCNLIHDHFDSSYVNYVSPHSGTSAKVDVPFYRDGYMQAIAYTHTLANIGLTLLSATQALT